jgi:hypothetical protein
MYIRRTHTHTHTHTRMLRMFTNIHRCLRTFKYTDVHPPMPHAHGCFHTDVHARGCSHTQDKWYIDISTPMYTRTCASIHTRMHIHTRTHIHTQTYIHIRASTHEPTHTHTHTHTHLRTRCVRHRHTPQAFPCPTYRSQRDERAEHIGTPRVGWSALRRTRWQWVRDRNPATNVL